uniref:Transmembrane protein n=1 Tax=Globodera pallida TaxID=36090 RepID=A0A183BIM5_GLOPA
MVQTVKDVRVTMQTTKIVVALNGIASAHLAKSTRRWHSLFHRRLHRLLLPTKKPTKAPKPTTTTTKPSKGHRFVAEVPLALGLPMLLGILPFFHDMFAMLYGYHIN